MGLQLLPHARSSAVPAQASWADGPANPTKDLSTPKLNQLHHGNLPINARASRIDDTNTDPTATAAMVLQDLGRRISGAVHNLAREPNLDEKVRPRHTGSYPPPPHHR